MTSSGPRAEAWERVRSCEDVLAVLAEIETRRKVIRVQAWHRGDDDQLIWRAVHIQGQSPDALLLPPAQVGPPEVPL